MKKRIGLFIIIGIVITSLIVIEKYHKVKYIYDEIYYTGDGLLGLLYVNTTYKQFPVRMMKQDDANSLLYKKVFWYEDVEWKCYWYISDGIIDILFHSKVKHLDKIHYWFTYSVKDRKLHKKFEITRENWEMEYPRTVPFADMDEYLQISNTSVADTFSEVQHVLNEILMKWIRSNSGGTRFSTNHYGRYEELPLVYYYYNIETGETELTDISALTE